MAAPQLPSPTPIPTFVDEDRVVVVEMNKIGSISGMDLIAQFTTNEDDTVVAEKDVEVLDAGSTTTKATVQFRFAPDADDMPVPEAGGGYKYWLYNRTAGGRKVIAWGSLSVRKRTTATEEE